MGKTNIEWADYTFNPWYGCQKVGPGCDHCYAEGWAKRSGLVEWGPHAERRRSSAKTWQAPISWNAAAQKAGTRFRVFCASLADVFDNQAPNEWRADLWELIRKTPHLDWLLVTKRISNALTMLPADFSAQRYPNVWLGVTVTDQAEADRDIPYLLALNAAVRFLSVEPLLGPIDLTRLDMNVGLGLKPDPTGNTPHHFYDALAGRSDIHPIHGAEPDCGALDWVIVGGESGPGARPANPHWVRDLRDQCLASETPFLFKQWGAWAPWQPVAGGNLRRDLETDRVRHMLGRNGIEGHFSRGDSYVRRLPKKEAGRVLDGQTWSQFPQEVQS